MRLSIILPKKSKLPKSVRPLRITKEKKKNSDSINFSANDDGIEGMHKAKKKPKTRKLICLIFSSLIILTLTFLTYLGLWGELNKLTKEVQIVTIISEGPAAEMYPDSMGQYNVLRGVYRYNRPVYKHVDREDRFIIFAGKINY